MFPVFPILQAISTASSVLKYIESCDVERDVSKPLCVNFISSGITELMQLFIFSFACSLVNPETSMFLMYTPFAIVVLFSVIIENVPQTIVTNSITIANNIPKITNTSDLFVFASSVFSIGLNSLVFSFSIFSCSFLASFFSSFCFFSVSTFFSGSFCFFSILASFLISFCFVSVSTSFSSPFCFVSILTSF